MFRTDDANRGNLKDTHQRTKSGAPGEYVYTSRMGEVYMFIGVKADAGQDFFKLTDPSDNGILPDDDTLPGDHVSSYGGILPDDGALPGYWFTTRVAKKSPDDKKAKYRASALGRSTHYAHVVQTRQFRVCVYSISIAGTTARLLRWDRSGVVVTQSFNYKSNPKPLIDFLWRFSKATSVERGFDCSAVSVDSEADRQQFLDAIMGHVKEQLPRLSAKRIEEETERHLWPGAVTRLTVGTDAAAHNIWVSRPMFTSKGVTGRSTRGYWGVDCESGEVVFIKDLWRADVPGVKAEGVILEGLLKAGVRNIPELVRHGHILDKGKAVFLVSVNLEVSSCTIKA